jgi:DNA invertase Pin-like site-specific DNA recombinase
VRSGGQSERRAHLEAQRRALAASCKRRGWQLLEALEEADSPAEERKRPGIQLSRRLLASADPQALLARKQDRPSNVLVELASLLASAQRQGWALLTLECTPEPRTQAGEAAVQVLADFAPCERGLHSQRIRQALARKRAQGVRLGRPPTMSPYALERIRRERKSGKSLAAIAQGLNADHIPTAQGGRRWYPATVRYTLTRAE